MRIFILFSKKIRSSFPHLVYGPIIIPAIKGNITGISIELKKGAPTEIFELNKTLANNG